MPKRFVILHHRLDSGEHWDLMLEHGDVLLTWALSRQPVERSSLPIPATRIADHRKHYLDYEGPVSQDRGSVSRVDSGTVEFEQITGSRFEFNLQGPRLKGRYALVRLDDGWTLQTA